MQIAVSNIECGAHKETWTLHHLTDLHDGAVDHARAELDERIREIADDPTALWIGGGDYGDLIVPGDPRFTGDVVEDEWRDVVHRIPDFYLERLTERLAPIADKCVGLASGNHEQVIGNRYHRGVAAELAARLGRPHVYLGVRGWAYIRFGRAGKRLPVKAFVYHGWSAGRLKGRKALQAERDLGAWNADVFMLGHDHQPYADLWYTEDVADGGGSSQGPRLRQRPRAVINGGSWTYGRRPPHRVDPAHPSQTPNEMWVEGRNFRPQAPGGPRLLIHLDFGSGQKPDRKAGSGVPAHFTLEVRQHAAPVEYGA